MLFAAGLLLSGMLPAQTASYTYLDQPAPYQNWSPPGLAALNKVGSSAPTPPTPRDHPEHTGPRPAEATRGTAPPAAFRLATDRHGQGEAPSIPLRTSAHHGGAGLA